MDESVLLACQSCSFDAFCMGTRRLHFLIYHLVVSFGKIFEGKKPYF